MRVRATFVLCACFACSFLGRMAVLASEFSGENDANRPKEAAPSIIGAESKARPSPKTAAEIEKSLSAADAREDAVAEKEAALKVYEAQLSKRLDELDNKNALLKSYIDTLETSRIKDIQKLASIYDSMKPAAAGEILIEMDPKFAAGLLSHMESEKAAGIVAAMEPKKAAAVSLLLASRSLQ